MSDETLSQRPAPAIRAVDLERVFDGGNVRALDGISFEVEAGESVAIVGPSGSGKTTLLNVLGLLDRPTRGVLEIVGVPILGGTQLDALRARTVGFVFQLHSLLPNLTAVENVELPMMPWQKVRRIRLERARHLLDQVGLGGRSDFRAVKLSGGERQRVAVARALANSPAILLCDEPTGSLDTATGRLVVDLLLESQLKHGVTLIVVTHDPEVAGRMGRTIELRDGRIVDPNR